MLHIQSICSEEGAFSALREREGRGIVWLQEPLDDILSSRGKVAVLRVICSVDVPLSGREIARRAGIASGHTSGILRELTDSGLLLCRDHGRVKTYELAEPNAMIPRRLRALFDAESERRTAFVEELSEALPNVVSVILFGSEARGEAVAGSDTDLLIVVGRATEKVRRQIDDVCLRLATQHQLDLRWLVADTEQLREWEQEDSEFWRNVRSEGIALAGTAVRRIAR